MPASAAAMIPTGSRVLREHIQRLGVLDREQRVGELRLCALSEEVGGRLRKARAAEPYAVVSENLP